MKGILGIIPAFFTSFACCGGGLLALVIGSTAFSSLALYSKYMAPFTIALLAMGTVLTSIKIYNTNRARHSILDSCQDTMRRQEVGK